MPRFFFSYSRDNNDEYLLQFFKDLQKEVDDLSGDRDSGYIDQAEHEPGDVWEARLEQGLRTARVFVAVLTANYCDKPYCGKEWAAFADRVRRYQAAAGLVDDPGLLMPLPWVPRRDRRPWPDPVRERHRHVGNPADDVNTKGLKYLAQLRSRFTVEYVDAVRALAERIVDLSEQHATLDTIADVPALATVAPAFPGPVAPATARGGGPARVHFVYAAPAPAEAQLAGCADLQPYGVDGGAEWQPFGADHAAVGVVAPNVATSDALKMLAGELPLGPDLPQRVRTLESRNELVVMLLDRWSAQVPAHAATLRVFDQNNYLNCSVLVPRPTQVADARLAQGLAQVMRHRLAFGGPLLIRQDIDSEDGLRLALHEVLVRLRNEVIAGAVPPADRLPASAPKPAVTAHPVPAAGGTA